MEKWSEKFQQHSMSWESFNQRRRINSLEEINDWMNEKRRTLLNYSLNVAADYSVYLKSNSDTCKELCYGFHGSSLCNIFMVNYKCLNCCSLISSERKFRLTSSIILINKQKKKLFMSPKAIIMNVNWRLN